MTIAEHDVVHVCRDIEVDGYRLSHGMIGTIVDVYERGSYAVEMAGLRPAPVVVTLPADAIQIIRGGQ